VRPQCGAILSIAAQHQPRTRARRCGIIYDSGGVGDSGSGGRQTEPAGQGDWRIRRFCSRRSSLNEISGTDDCRPSFECGHPSTARHQNAESAGTAVAAPPPCRCPTRPSAPSACTRTSATKENSESRVPRSLPCTHSVCSGCLLRLLAATHGSVTAGAARADSLQMQAANRQLPHCNERSRDDSELLTLQRLGSLCVSVCAAA